MDYRPPAPLPPLFYQENLENLEICQLDRLFITQEAMDTVN